MSFRVAVRTGNMCWPTIACGFDHSRPARCSSVATMMALSPTIEGRRQARCAVPTSLRAIASAVSLERQPLERMVRWRVVANVLSIGFVGSQMLPVFGWKIVEHQECIVIFGEAFGPPIFQFVALDEGVEGCLGSDFGRGHPDLL